MKTVSLMRDPSRTRPRMPMIELMISAPVMVEPSTTRLSWISESTMLAGGRDRARV